MCYGDWSFLVNGPALWNCLPVVLNSPDMSVGIFKDKLQNCLINAHLRSCEFAWCKSHYYYYNYYYILIHFNVCQQLEKRRKRLKMKLEMAKFLQDTIEETALQRKDGPGEGETVKEFVKFMDKVRLITCCDVENSFDAFLLCCRKS